jgi:hypothetical protein
MKRSLVISILIGTLIAGAAQAREVAANSTVPAATPAALHHTLKGYVSSDGVPSYLMRKNGTLINGLLPTNPDAQG